jgi:hypothetical protein
VKKAVSLLAAVFLSLPLFARTIPHAARLARLTAGSPASLSVATVDPQLPARLLGQLRAQLAARHAQGRMHASAVADSVSVRAFIIPVGGSTAGGGGTLFFRSDVTLVNYGTTAEKVLAGFWPAGSTNTLAPASYKQLTLDAGRFYTLKDFVATTMGTSGLGTLVFIPFNGSDLDPEGAVDGFSRIYTKQPGSNGTVSQPFEAVDPDTTSLVLSDEGVALGLVQDANYRTNFGVVNVDAAAHNVSIQFIGENSSTTITRTVPAYGMIFEAAPAGDFGALQIMFDITDAGNNFVSWVGFASSTDNTTGDGWVSISSANLSPGDLDLVGY